MSDFQFNLPLNKESLLEHKDGYYFVNNICIISQLRDKLKEAANAFHYDGPAAVLKHFDTYYSVIYHGEKLPVELVNETVKALTKPCQQLNSYLLQIIELSELPEDIRIKTLNVLKMLIYLYSQTTILLEYKIDIKNKNDLNVTKKGGRGKVKVRKTEEDFDVEFKIRQLGILLKIIELPIYKFWNPPVCEEQFISLISEICFSFLTNPAVKYVKEICDILFFIFGTLIKNYSYSLTFTVRLTQVIKDYEHLESIVPLGIKILVETYNSTGLVRELVRELTEWQSDEAYLDSAGSKHCSFILIELTALMPNLMLTEVVYLLKYLNNNSHTLRNCILSIITKVILKILTKDNLSAEQTEIRDKLLNKLLLHIRDLHAYVRSKVLQHWTLLHKEAAIPQKMQLDVLKLATDRLHDKGALVRKAAIQLVTVFLKCNPYAATLNLDKYQKEINEEMEKAKTMTLKTGTATVMESVQDIDTEWNNIKDEVTKIIEECLEDDEDENENIDPNMKNEIVIRDLLKSNKIKQAFLICKTFVKTNEDNYDVNKMDTNDLCNFYMTFMKSIYYKDVLNQCNLNQLAESSPEQLKELEACNNTLNYLHDVIKFLEFIDTEVFPTMKVLLNSSVMSDLHEAVDFFVTAYQFQLNNASEGLAALLSQMNSTEQDRKKIIIDAYKNVFLSCEESEMKEKHKIIVFRLIKLLKSIQATDIGYFTGVVREWGTKGDIDQVVIQHLWHMFIGQITDIDNDDRVAALQLLTMISTGRRTVIERNINLVAEIVFGNLCLADPRYLIIGCQMISIMEEEIDVQSNRPCFRLPFEDTMWSHLLEKIVELVKRRDPFCYKAISVSLEMIYKICQKPELLVTKLLNSIISMYKNPENNIIVNKKIHVKYLALVCHLIGEIAIQQFVYFDSFVYKELKRRNNIKEEAIKSQKNLEKRKSLNISKASESGRNTNDYDDTGLEGAQADDPEAEYILNVCENELVSNNLLGQFLKMFVMIVCNPERFNNEELQASVVQALIRYMILSSRVSQEYLGRVMNILLKSKYSSVKNNIFVGLADLLRRFPNIVEPFSQQIYNVVKDEDETVRLTAVTVLSKLILEDMLRVKGTVADLALCIVDTSETVVHMTEEFFYLLSQKGNAIYNVLPDVISRLSNNNEQINQDVFQKVMAFLIQLISKDKQIESLVEKLCMRFKLTDNSRSWEDIIYCLTLLTYNEKSLTRLHENYNEYKRCLEHDPVYDGFISICNKYRNNSKDDIKSAAKKLEDLIRTGQIANEEMLENESRINKKSAPKRKRNKKVKILDDTDDD